MADFPSKKAKIAARGLRVRYTLELAVEPGMKERLESVKTRIQRLKERLHSASRTPMANVILMEQLLDLFEWSEQRGMVSESNSSLFTSCSFAQAPHLASDAATQTDINGSNFFIARFELWGEKASKKEKKIERSSRIGPFERNIVF